MYMNRIKLHIAVLGYALWIGGILQLYMATGQ